MKKLIMSLATIALMTGSIANMTAFVNQKAPVAKNPGVSFQAKNEDAEDIANKIWNKTVKIDPNFWFNKDIKSDQTDFNKQLVQQGILTEDEVQYVSWGSLNINKAGWFTNQGVFTVSKDGATASGHVTVDASGGETTTQIAAKIAKANIKFNYNYWNQKAVGSYFSQVQSILVNEKILTKGEAADVTGLKSPVTITKAGTVVVNLNLNNNKTSGIASAHVNVVNDGNSAEQIAQEVGPSRIGSNGYYDLKTNVVGQYADASGVISNWRNLLVDVYGISSSDANALGLPHVKLQGDNPNVQAFATKDGQIFTQKVHLRGVTDIYYYNTTDRDMTWYSNLNPTMVKDLKSYFPSHSSGDDLGYFYNMLDDDDDYDHLPSYDGTKYIPWGDRLEDNFGYSFRGGNEPDLLLAQLAITDSITNPGNAALESALYQQVMSSSSNNGLGVAINWYQYGDQQQDIGYDTGSYDFW